MPPEDAFPGSSMWFRLKYEITVQEGVKVITALSGSEVEWYDPLSSSVLPKRPHWAEEQENVSPHTDLASLNLNSINKILKFVNNWGLLGLWKVPDYQKAANLQGKNTFRIGNGRFSEWFLHPHKLKNHSWQEPLEIFIEAAEKYQKLFSDISEVGKPEGYQALSITIKLNSELRGIRPGISFNEKGERFAIWQFNSLYDFVHLQIFLSLMNNKAFRRCKYVKCRRFFVTTHRENQYCSNLCRTNHLVKSHRLKQWKEELFNQFLTQGIERTWLEEQINSLLSKPGIGQKKAAKRLTELINERVNKDGGKN